MRRGSGGTLPEVLRGDPPERPAKPPRPEVTLELETITPVIGGGVETGEPDPMEAVRGASVRGVLRWWWRSLYLGPPGRGATTDIHRSLLREEARLWGGVGLGEETASGTGAWSSCVRIRVEVEDPGRELAAGFHEAVGGKLRSLPRWSVGSNLGYALFPLQRTFEERQQHTGGGSMPTRPVREGIRFRLYVELDVERFEERGRKERAADLERTERNGMRELLATLWAWSAFGGLGARTRRGFGSLKLRRMEIANRGGVDEKQWRAAFGGPQAGEIVDLQRWLTRAGGLCEPRPGRLWPPRLFVGQPRSTAAEAHDEIVGHLAELRQGRGVGRARGGQRPGQSHWPEAHLLRKLSTATGFEHHPPDDADQWGAPRAAFGLPLEMQFKGRSDRQANARISLLPGEGSRWPSPLLLRVLPTDRGFCPALLILNLEPPRKVRVEFTAGAARARQPDSVDVVSATGAQEPIAQLLRDAEGNAVESFASWLTQEHRFREVVLVGGTDRA